MDGQTANEFSLMLLFFPNCFYSFQKLKLILFNENLKHLLVIYLLHNDHYLTILHGYFYQTFLLSHFVNQ